MGEKAQAVIKKTEAKDSQRQTQTGRHTMSKPYVRLSNNLSAFYRLVKGLLLPFNNGPTGDKLWAQPKVADFRRLIVGVSALAA
jgi:hypothetical protein